MQIHFKLEDTLPQPKYGRYVYNTSMAVPGKMMDCGEANKELTMNRAFHLG
jgi:hypothetical protein